MSQYLWSNLSDYDFEGVCRDVLAVELGCSVESFGRGRDGGIDLRHFFTDGTVVGQCKHYLRSSFSKLKSDMVQETVKIAALKSAPTKYYLFTSQSLSPSQKDALLKVMPPSSSVNCIYGLEDIEGIISAHPELEQHHYKLWLSSVRVLELILGNATRNRSKFRADEITRRSKLFVQSEQMKTAYSTLTEEHSLIISGPPGVGKTTMAEMLALKLMSQNFAPVFASSIFEIEERYSPNSKQVFLFDDFLGKTNLSEMTHGGSQEQLVTLLRQVRSVPNKYFILTTREYLFREAQITRDRLVNNRVPMLKLVLQMENYSRLQKAQILYNHIYWHPGIEAESLQLFIESKAYNQIIDHVNYNPRLVADTLDRLFPTRAVSEAVSWI